MPEETLVDLGDIFGDSQTSEEVEAVDTEESEEILEEETTEDEIIEDDSKETEEEVEENVDVEDPKAREYDGIEIKFQDDERTSLNDFTNEEIQKYMQLGEKAEFQIEKANVKSQETVEDFKNVAEMYDLTVDELITQLEDQIFNSRSTEPGGKDEGRHVDDIKNEYKTSKKAFKERSIGKLLDANPDLTSDTIPKEVLQDLKYGKDIKESYEKHVLKSTNTDLQSEVEKLKKEIKVLNQNNKSKSKAFVKSKSGGSKEAVSSLSKYMDNVFK